MIQNPPICLSDRVKAISLSLSFSLFTTEKKINKQRTVRHATKHEFSSGARFVLSKSLSLFLSLN